MKWVLVLLLAMLGGCALLPPATAPVARPVNFESSAFALNGRISFQHLGKRQSAGLHWKHLARSDEILLLTPLGQTAARVYRDDTKATLDDGSRHYQDADAEALMQQVLGWHLPLNGLHYWVLGKADPDGAAQIERAANGQISVLRQDGWEVRFLRYADSKPGDCAQASGETAGHSTGPSKDAGQVAGSGAGMSPPRLLPQSAGCASNGEADSLPARLQLSNGDMQLQLLIDEWDWNPQ